MTLKSPKKMQKILMENLITLRINRLMTIFLPTLGQNEKLCQQIPQNSTKKMKNQEPKSIFQNSRSIQVLVTF